MNFDLLWNKALLFRFDMFIEIEFEISNYSSLIRIQSFIRFNYKDIRHRRATWAGVLYCRARVARPSRFLEANVKSLIFTIGAPPPDL